MNNQTTESKKVRKFLGRLSIGIALVALAAIVYVNTDEPPLEINPAAETSIDIRSNLETEMNVQLEEIDNWITLLKAKQSQYSVDHSEHIDELETIKLQLLTTRSDLLEREASIVSIEESMAYLNEKFVDETRSISFSQTVDIE
ncbi:MAG: hypothetical protein RLP15_04375 [Cryomorphaceae bacterium]